MADKSILFDILARDRASAAFDSAGRSADKLTESTGRLGTATKAALLAGAAAAGTFAIKVGHDAIEAAKESMKVSAQTDAAILSTGGAANVTASQVGNYAHQLQIMSGIQDETIQTGQNMLLTFTGIKNGVGEGNDIFNQASLAMLNMSVRMGTDASGAAVQLGKALQDPIKGISALHRVGVEFDDQQKAQIKTMVESGDTMGAQKVILAELNKEFGGSAAAAGNAMTAGERLSLRWHDMEEELGNFLIPKINSLIGGLMASADWVDRNRAVVIPVVAVLGTLAAVVGTVIAAEKAWTAVQTALDIVLSANPIGLIIIGLAALAAAIVIAYQRSDTFREVVDKAFTVAKLAVAPFVLEIKAVIAIVEAAIDTMQRLAHAAAHLPGAGVVGGIISHIPGFAGGVSDFSGGLALVGERGPELVNLPRGSGVTPASQTAGLLSNEEVIAELRALRAEFQRGNDKKLLLMQGR